MLFYKEIDIFIVGDTEDSFGKVMIFTVRKFEEITQNSNSWIKDSILLLYVFLMLIFRNGLVSQVGEFKYYMFILGGSFVIMLIDRLIIEFRSSEK